MKKLLAFAGSTSSKSINKRFVTAVANAYFQDYEVRILDLNDFEMPVFSEDKERENGHPEEAYAFSNNIRWADGILMSLAEHNAAYTAAFKNTFDWTSRLPERTVWEDKPLMVMATSDGGRGAQSVLGMAVDRFPRNGGEVICSFSLPRFSENFDPKLAIKDEQLRKELESRIEKFKSSF